MLKEKDFEPQSAIENNGIWDTLINDATLASNSSSICSSGVKNIVILGDSTDIKSDLVSKIKGCQETYFGPAIDFHSMEVKDKDGDSSSHCNLWVMDENLAYRGLLELSLSGELFHHSLVLLSVDLSRPWDIAKSLNKWIHVLTTFIHERSGFENDYIEMCKKQLMKNFQTYVEPGNETGSTELELDGLALSSNLGISIIVVCSNAEHIEILEKQDELKEEQIDFIQFYLRKFCLRFGAALVYVSSKTGKNIKLLRDYVLNKLYYLDFATSPLLSNADLFIPCGWDSEKRINILAENFSNKITINETFEKNIPNTQATYKLQELKELIIDDEQTFLTKFQAELGKSPTSGKNVLPNTAHKSASHVPKTVGNVDVNNDKMLTMFFNSLLSKKPNGN